MSRVLRSLVAGSLLTLGVSGCEIDVDLTASPTAPLGGTIDMEVKVTNQSNCPVGLVTAIVIPNIPRNILIDQIPDDQIRRDVSRAVDEFCSSGEFTVPDGAEAFCNLDGGDLNCTIDLGDGIDIPAGTEESLIVGIEESHPEISCSSDGDKITCRIPKGLVEQAGEIVDQGNEQLPLICTPMGPIVLCASALLSPGEMRMDDFQVAASIGGVVRHFVIAFPQVAGGVCKGGLLGGGPCNTNAECPGIGMIPAGTCKPGICSGSSTASLNGKGCDPAIASDCTNGTCSLCTTGSNSLLDGVACETTAVGASAPTMSMWGYITTAIALCVASMFLLMRARRREA